MAAAQADDQVWLLGNGAPSVIQLWLLSSATVLLETLAADLCTILCLAIDFMYFESVLISDPDVELSLVPGLRSLCSCIIPYIDFSPGICCSAFGSNLWLSHE